MRTRAFFKSSNSRVVTLNRDCVLVCIASKPVYVFFSISQSHTLLNLNSQNYIRITNKLARHTQKQTKLYILANTELLSGFLIESTNASFDGCLCVVLRHGANNFLRLEMHRVKVIVRSFLPVVDASYIHVN